MSYIDRSYYEQRATNKFKDKDKKPSTDIKIIKDITTIISKINNKIAQSSIQDAATWLLEKDDWLSFEESGPEHYPQLGRGRVINVNPGIDNIGREQRYIHMYIVLAEYKETFVGVPITNAKIKNNKPVLRNEMEVLLINPNYKKPYKEFRCPKPSVVDLRNIRGFDKKRIVKDSLYKTGRFIPDTYKSDIDNAILKLFIFNQDKLIVNLIKDLAEENLNLKKELDRIGES